MVGRPTILETGSQMCTDVARHLQEPLLSTPVTDLVVMTWPS